MNVNEFSSLLQIQNKIQRNYPKTYLVAFEECSVTYQEIVIILRQDS